MALSHFYWPLVALFSIDPCVVYPLRGIQYFLTHPALWGNLFMLVIPQFTLTTVVIIAAFAFLFPPQATLAFVLNGPAGIAGSLIGMFQQSMSIVRGISELFLFPKPLRILFDGVLTHEGMDYLILQGRMQPKGKYDQSDYRRVLSWFKCVPRRLLFPSWLFMVLVRFFLLTFIPIFGPMILIILDAPSTANRCLGRYFELKNWDEPRIDAFIARNRWKYYTFGILATALEYIPFVGFAFAFTNTAGGALWACKIDKEVMLQSGKGANQKNLKRNRLLYSFGN